MQKIIFIMLNFILDFKKKSYRKKLENFKKLNSFEGGCNNSADLSTTLDLNSKMREKKEKINLEIQSIVKNKLDNPEKILSIAQKAGTPVYRLPAAKKLLSVIGEHEGFIAPMSGLRALYLNFVINLILYGRLTTAFKSTEMFVFATAAPDMYNLLHQFHQWYSYKKNLPGYGENTRHNFNMVLDSTNSDSQINKMTLGELHSIKELVARETEAIDFVLELARQNEGSRKSMKKIINGDGANI